MSGQSERKVRRTGCLLTFGIHRCHADQSLDFSFAHRFNHRFDRVFIESHGRKLQTSLTECRKYPTAPFHVLGQLERIHQIALHHLEGTIENATALDSHAYLQIGVLHVR